MARIRKTAPDRDGSGPVFWKVGTYIRLSREDGHAVSESVVNQWKIL